MRGTDFHQLSPRQHLSVFQQAAHRAALVSLCLGLITAKVSRTRAERSLLVSVGLPTCKTCKRAVWQPSQRLKDSVSFHIHFSVSRRICEHSQLKHQSLNLVQWQKPVVVLSKQQNSCKIWLCLTRFTNSNLQAKPDETVAKSASSSVA